MEVGSCTNFIQLFFTSWKLPVKPHKEKSEYKAKLHCSGDCGILINPVKAEDYGLWQCGAMLAATKDGEELIRNLVLEAPSKCPPYLT